MLIALFAPSERVGRIYRLGPHGEQLCTDVEEQYRLHQQIRRVVKDVSTETVEYKELAGTEVTPTYSVQ